jgi:hypothetical protein
VLEKLDIPEPFLHWHTPFEDQDGTPGFYQPQGAEKSGGAGAYNEDLETFTPLELGRNTSRCMPKAHVFCFEQKLCKGIRKVSPYPVTIDDPSLVPGIQGFPQNVIGKWRGDMKYMLDLFPKRSLIFKRGEFDIVEDEVHGFRLTSPLHK